MWKKLFGLILAAAMAFSLTGCGGAAKEEVFAAEPGVSQMKAICELSTMECYYHNVAKYYKKDASGFGPFKKDKHFWIEYGGIVKVGVNAELVNITVKDDKVKITLPQAAVLETKVDSATLTPEAFIVDSDSAAVTAEDEREAFQEAQQRMQASASADHALLNEAQQRVQLLLEDYVNNIGELAGKRYAVEWVYLNESGLPTGQTEIAEEKASSSEAAA